MFEFWPDFTKGMVIGVSIAAPVGPIGVLCIRNTLAHGLPIGLATGLGAAVADALYAAVGAAGIGAVSVFLEAAGPTLRIVGIALLLWIAWTTWRKASPQMTDSSAPREKPAAGHAFLSTFALTLANPMTVLSFAAIFAGTGLGIATEASSDAAMKGAALVIGTLVGSAAWWLALSGGVSILRKRVDQRAMQMVNKASALMLLGFAAWMAISAAA